MTHDQAMLLAIAQAEQAMRLGDVPVGCIILDTDGNVVAKSAISFVSPQVDNGMQGVLEEGSEVLEELEKSDLRDAALIGAAQRVEHYEMAGYGCVIEYATLLGHKDSAKLLQATLDEEKAADEKLGKIAQKVNSAALKQAA